MTDHAEHVEHIDGDNLDLSAPVPVSIVGGLSVTDRRARTVTAEAIPLGITPTRIAADNPQRARLLVHAPTGVVVVSGDPGVTAGTGFLLPAGQSVELHASGAVYAVADAPTTVHVLSENYDG